MPVVRRRGGFRRQSIINIVRRMLDVSRNRSGRSILLFFYTVFALGWFAQASGNLVTALGKWDMHFRVGWRLGQHPRAFLLNAALDVVGPAFCFVLAVLLMWLHELREGRTAPGVDHLAPPEPCQGLIWMLSPYTARDSQIRGTDRIRDDLPDQERPGFLVREAHFLQVRLQDADAKQGRPWLRAELLRSNWGPLVVAVEHHAARLRHCWIACTPGSQAQFDAAQWVVHAFAGPKATCHQRHCDQNDIGDVVNSINYIYEEALMGGASLAPHEVIADFTGGTAAMSGGMVVATIEEERQIEYVRQDRPLFRGSTPLTPAEMRQRGVLVAVRTTRRLVPEDDASA